MGNKRRHGFIFLWLSLALNAIAEEKGEIAQSEPEQVFEYREYRLDLVGIREHRQLREIKDALRKELQGQTIVFEKEMMRGKVSLKLVTGSTGEQVALFLRELKNEKTGVFYFREVKLDDDHLVGNLNGKS